MILYDCHVHTSFSDDSVALPKSQIEAAIGYGLKGICITDHMDYDYPDAELAGIKFEFDEDVYWKQMCELRDSYKDIIDVRIGMEAGLRNEKECIDTMQKNYSRILEKYPLDFVIGSTHCLENTDPYYPKYWQDKTVNEGLRKYFIACTENMKNYDCFDASGHFDYIVRYVPKSESWRGVEDYNPLDFMDITDEFLKTLIHKGKALECNTAGLKYGLGFSHPHDIILKRYAELGGELLTIGSDGHKPEHVAYDFRSVCEHLKALGYKYYNIYKDRKPEFLKL